MERFKDKVSSLINKRVYRMLRIRIIKTKPGTKSSVMVTCPHCNVVLIKEAPFPDLWGEYSVVCAQCEGDSAPIYHLLNKKEIRVLWHRNNGFIKPKLEGKSWTPVSAVVVKPEEERVVKKIKSTKGVIYSAFFENG